MERRGHLVIMAICRDSTWRISQQRSIGKCFLEDMDEGQEQPQDHLSRIPQLVCPPRHVSYEYTEILTSKRLKDCDVTWLYGPLQSGPKNIHPTHTEPSSVSLSKADSLVNLNKKPILKK